MTLGSRKILIVDDDESTLDTLAAALGDRFDLRRAGSGEEALLALRDFRAELVLVDVALPGIDGYETCRRIVAEPRTRNVKVILVGAGSTTADRLRGYRSGACDYLVEPLDAEELTAKVDVFLALKSAQDETMAKSEFVANMSHEIRTPMTAILGYSENLRDPSLSDAARQEAIDTIWRNGQHLLELLNNILDLSKIEADRVHIEQIECRPADIVAEVVAMMRPRAEAYGLQLTAALEGMVPVRILSDRTRIKQVLLNLVGNALKFTKAGSVRIVVRMRAEHRPEPLLEIDVVDTGIGIEPAVVETLFEPFVQADASVTRRFGGTGLGLSISRRLARMLGGDIVVRSEPGRGSTFTFTVATGSLSGIEACGAIDIAEAGHPRERNPAPLPRIPCRILLAEDGHDNQRLMSFVLRKAGAEVTLAENGKIAVDTALAATQSGQPFDVILMDMQMPVLDGYSATAMLRQSGYRGAIVAVTAHAMAEDQQRCLDSGCDGFASKPVDRTALVRTIHELLVRPR
ncbi:MAG: response regulator [Planctomycetes bacterium]|nr:response regulator [Planctomycetota bacterium]